MVETYTNPNANVEGVVDERYGGDVIHYRGLKYGSIEKRFDSPRAVTRNKSLRQLAVQYGFVLHRPNGESRLTLENLDQDVHRHPWTCESFYRFRGTCRSTRG